MQPDHANNLIAELKRLNHRELRLTLKELNPDERGQVLTLIEQADRSKPAPTFESLVGLSPWLLNAIDVAKTPLKSDAGQPLTSASRAALLSALDKLEAVSNDNAPAMTIAGRTFLGRMLARRRARGWAS